MSEKVYVLTQDGEFKFRGTNNECYYKLQKLQPQSAHWATTHEGWAVKEELYGYWRQPTKGELKFGEGAIHWRDFKIEECGKADFTLKKWFIADDGLRYYRY
jgi:hypothetical protein